MPSGFLEKGDNSAADLEREITLFVESGTNRKQADIRYVAGLGREQRDFLYDEQGQLTPDGLAADRYMNALAAAGMRSPENRWAWATIALERDALAELCDQRDVSQDGSACEADVPQQQPHAEPVKWAVGHHTTADGERGKIVTIGPFVTWIREGDDAQVRACINAINSAFRAAQADELCQAIVR
jgi:hypothetical protein